ISHLFRHSSGLLICTYGYRLAPYGVRVMFSHDEGETWDVDHDLYINNVSPDVGYPSTVELSDGSLVTIFYAIPAQGEKAKIMQQKWRFE
ncbi:MAG: exo-alpha-sialidase, partial [Clostridia bacterium]|nr:exo-alpha-sialidase [Clostridia bacterium]